MSVCPCGNNKPYESCCQPIHQQPQLATKAVQLMRARYTAHVLQLVDFIVATHHPSTKHEIDLAGLLQWIKTTKWLQLEVKGGQKGGATDTNGKVRFLAHYEDQKGKKHTHHELSTFQKEGNQWYFVKGETPPAKFMLKKK